MLRPRSSVQREALPRRLAGRFRGQDVCMQDEVGLGFRVYQVLGADLHTSSPAEPLSFGEISPLHHLARRRDGCRIALRAIAITTCGQWRHRFRSDRSDQSTPSWEELQIQEI